MFWWSTFLLFKPWALYFWRIMWQLILIFWLLFRHIRWSLFRGFSNIFHWIYCLLLWDFLLLNNFISRQFILNTLLVGLYLLLYFFSFKTCLGSLLLLLLRKSSRFNNWRRSISRFPNLINLRLYFLLHFYSLYYFTIFLLQFRLRQ